MLATGARPRRWNVLDEAGKAVEGVLDISQRKPICAYSSFHMLPHSKPTVTLLGGLLGPVRLRELNCITQGLRDGPWQPGFNPSQILKPVECLPSFLLLCFASQEAGKKARDD